MESITGPMIGLIYWPCIKPTIDRWFNSQHFISVYHHALV